MKIYNFGLVLGRFQMLHRGHVKMIKHALSLCNTVIVYVGSSQESRTEKNPFTYEERKQMLELAFKDQIKTGEVLIRPLPDIGVGNNSVWGQYVIGLYESEFGTQPNLYVTGCEKTRASWFTDDIAPTMDELRLSRDGITASSCRELVEKNRQDLWMNKVPYEIWPNFDKYKEILNNIGIVEDEKDTSK